MSDQHAVLDSSRGRVFQWYLRTRQGIDSVQIDPKLVMPEWAAPLAMSADLSFHAVPAIALAADLLLFSPPYAIKLGPALGLSGVIAFGYWIWIERCYRFNKFYPYPLFVILTTAQRVKCVTLHKHLQLRLTISSLFAFSALLMTLSTAALTWLYGMVNGKEVQELGNGEVQPEAKSNSAKTE